MTDYESMMQEAKNFGGNAGSRLHQVTPASSARNTGSNFVFNGLSTPKCSSGTSQSRPFPARPVKIMESAWHYVKTAVRHGKSGLGEVPSVEKFTCRHDLSVPVLANRLPLKSIARMGGGAGKVEVRESMALHPRTVSAGNLAAGNLSFGSIYRSYRELLAIEKTQTDHAGGKAPLFYPSESFPPARFFPQERIPSFAGGTFFMECCPDCGFPWFDCICHPQWNSKITHTKAGRVSNGEVHQERNGFSPERLTATLRRDGAERLPESEKTCAEGSSRSYGKTGYEPDEDIRRVTRPIHFESPNPKRTGVITVNSGRRVISGQRRVGDSFFSVKRSRLARWAERLGDVAETRELLPSPQSGVSPARRNPLPHWSGYIGQQHNNCTTPAAVANCGRFSIFLPVPVLDNSRIAVLGTPDEARESTINPVPGQLLSRGFNRTLAAGNSFFRSREPYGNLSPVYGLTRRQTPRLRFL